MPAIEISLTAAIAAQRIFYQCRKKEVVTMVICTARTSAYSVDVPPITNKDGRACSVAVFVNMVGEKIGVARQTMYMVTAGLYCFTCHTGYTMCVPLAAALFSQPHVVAKLVYMLTETV